MTQCIVSRVGRGVFVLSMIYNFFPVPVDAMSNGVPIIICAAAGAHSRRLKW